MDFVSALIGAGIASVPQVLSHMFGAHKDRAATRRVHYEARLAAAREAFVFYDQCAELLDSGRAEPTELDDIQSRLRDTFGEPFANEADRAMWAKDNGDSYRAIVTRMKAHIADLERKTGMPPRLT